MSGAAFDIIGDIHGAADQLCELLHVLGYVETTGVFRHPSRRVLFLGDFIDRGPKQREVLDIVRPMVDGGSAIAVMGNHEFNAIKYATADPEAPGEFLRPHNDKHTSQHRSFLEAVLDSVDYAAYINWFKTLPIYLEFPDLRVVHACWHRESLDELRPLLNPDDTLKEEAYIKGARKGEAVCEALEILLKGMKTALPDSVHFHDKDGVRRDAVRVKWWLNGSHSYRELAFLSDDLASTLPAGKAPPSVVPGYGASDRPVFVGHYWLRGRPDVLAPNVCCVDYSVGKPGGKLCCYRFDGEQRLRSEKLVWVDRPER